MILPTTTFGACVLLAASTLCEGLSIYDRAADYISSTAKSLAKRAPTDPVAFKYSLFRYAFYVNVKIGSNADSVNLRLTDQPFFWVGSEKPSNCSRDVDRYAYLQCVYADWSGLYNPDDSSTFRNVSNTELSLSQSDETRFTRGYYGQDSVTFGDSELSNVYIGIADNYTQSPEFGIGVYDSDRQSYTSFLEYMYTERDIKLLAHGIYFNWLEMNASSMTMGAVDTSKYDGNLVTFNASQGAEITTVALNSAAFGSPGDMDELDAVIDLKVNVEFSTSRMSLPDSVIPAILRKTGAVFDSDWNGYLIDCDVRNSDLAFEFRFQGINITVEAHHFILPAYGIQGYRFQLDNKDACSLQVNPMSKYSIATDLGYEAVLGTPFARHVYMVHDYSNRQLSFQKVKFNVTETNVVVLDADGVAPLFQETPSPTSDPVPTDSASPQPTGTTKSSTPVGAIAGGVIGGVAGLAGIGLLGFFMMKRKKKTQGNINLPPPPPMMHSHMPTSPPAPNTAYNQVPAFDPSKPVPVASPISEMPTNDQRFSQYSAYGAWDQQQRPQSGYHENTYAYGYDHPTPQHPSQFAHELPSANQR